MKNRIGTLLTFVAILALLAASLPVMAAQREQAPPTTVEIFLADMDTSISAWEPDTSFGGQLNFYVRQPGIINGLAWFDLTPIPQGSRVHSATLRVYPTYRTNPNPLDLVVSTVMGPWDESVTWNTAPVAGEVVALATVQDVAETSLFDIDYQVTLDVTGVVQDWIADPDANYGFMLSAPAGTHRR